MLNATAMTVMSFIAISIASIVVATNNVALPIAFLFGALCQGWEQPMQLKGFLVEKANYLVRILTGKYLLC